jgi:CBS domain-containing protein
MLPKVTTVNRRALKRHAGTTALLVLDAQADEPVGIITAADIAAPSRTAMTSTTSGWMPR